ncbi:radical SAM protein [Desulfonatronospira sp.]|uniref:elongator complex protein 3 n=1 Tax=Desulfonatronospira sp. TaxID=1962951 RepID=UPI0025BE3FE0|nr:radical SAM protein [Desulfonatronospira sp.]
MNLPGLFFRHPEPYRNKVRLYPVFLPFAGCPDRCIYCSQETQTGQPIIHLKTIARKMHDDIYSEFSSSGKTFALGFFGGTFTAMPRHRQLLFLNLARELKDMGALSHVRCSTRPDYVNQDQLRLLQDYGVDMVELGVQSFDSRVLSLSRRGYTGDKALEASWMVKKSRMDLGIQLMPGLPGSNPGTFAGDMRITEELKPSALRLYPCLVLANTPLANLWSRGEYRPWILQTTQALISNALLRMWAAGIPVIRVGLAPETSLLSEIIAGPWHPALGSICRGLALGAYVAAMTARLGHPPARIFVPEKYIGDFWGHKMQNAGLFRRLGIFRKNTQAWKKELFLLAGAAHQLP